MRAIGSRRRGSKGSVMVIALLMIAVLMLLGSALLMLSSTESAIGFNAVRAEGAFQAAEAGINAGIDQLSANVTTATRAIPTTTIGGTFSYRSGHRADAGPQPLVYVSTRGQAGYSLESGTGYNNRGYFFYTYQINATGTGPRNAQREIEVQAEFGPAQ